MDLDNTKRKCYAQCPRRFKWEYIENLRPSYGSTALRFGLCTHEILENYYTVIKNDGWKAKSDAITKGALAGKACWERESKGRQFYEDYRTLENCLSSFIGYINHYEGDESFISIVELEKTFRVDLGEDIFFTGKVDGKVLLNGSNWLLEFKTSGQPIDKQMKTLQRSPQLLGYAFAGSQLDKEVEGILVSMIHVSSTKSRVTGAYGKTRIDFRRSPQIFTKGDLESWLDSFLWTARQVKESIKENYYPMLLDSCYTYGQCPYFSLCEQNTAPEKTNTQSFITVPNWNVLEDRKEISV